MKRKDSFNNFSALPRRSHSNAAKLIGSRFGRLTVVSRSIRESPTHPNYKSKQAFWVCRCDCGGEAVASTANLRSGHVKSCGCYQIERTKEIRKKEAEQRFGLSTQKKAYSTYKRNARSRGLSLEITIEQFLELSQKECYYCGVEPLNNCRNYHNNGDFIYNGLDRIDNSKGYTLENVVPCCRTCNVAKANLEVSDFLTWVHRVAAKNPL